MTWNTHHKTMLDWFIYLRKNQPDYYLFARETYTQTPNCPYPDIAQDVREAWKQLSNSDKTTGAEASE